MSPAQQRNALLGLTLTKHLKRRNIQAYYCPTAEAAVDQLQQLIADGDTVTWGGSHTLEELGVPDALRRRGTLTVLDRATAATPQEKDDIMRRAFSADVYLTSANAISQDGVIVNVDGNGNRVAAISWGPKKVIFLISVNKVTATVPDAVARARSTAAPVNAQRFSIDTPCHTTGVCHDCNSPESVCSYIHIFRNSRNLGRHTVILIGDTLGY